MLEPAVIVGVAPRWRGGLRSLGLAHPFLVSIRLLGGLLWIRLKLAESPAFPAHEGGREGLQDAA
jgi:hypothetical protein